MSFAVVSLGSEIASVDAEGYTGMLSSEWRDILNVKVGDTYDANQVDLAVIRLQEKLFQEGYWKAKIEAHFFEEKLQIEFNLGPLYHLQIIGQLFRHVGDIRQRILDKLHKNGLSERVLDQLVYQIRSMYRKNGFPEAKVEFADNNGMLVCDINEEKRVLVDEVHLEGAHYFNSDDLLSDANDFIKDQLVDLNLSGLPDWQTVGSILNPMPQPGESTALEVGYFPYDPALWADLKQRWFQTYARAGFLDAKITGPQITYSSEGHFVRLRYRIIEGEQSLIGEVIGSEASEDVAPGKPLSSSAIEALRTHIEQKLWNSGYPFASVKSEVTSTNKAYIVNVIYHVDEGERIQIGKIILMGNEVTQNSVLQRRLKIHEGDEFSLEKIAETRSSLRQTDLFDKVDIFLDPHAEGEIRPLVVEVKEGKQTRIELGFGASLEDGPRVIGILQRRNLMGLGLAFRTRLQLNYPAVFYHMPLFYYPDQIAALDKRFDNEPSGLRPFLYTEGRLSCGFEYPKIPIAPFDVDASFDVNAAREIKPSYNLNRLAFEMALTSNPLSLLRFSPQIELESALFQGDESSTSVRYRRIDSGQVNQWTLRLSSSLDRRDNPVDPHKGFSLELGGNLGLGQANLTVEGLRPVSYVRLFGAINGYVPLSRQVVWGTTAKWGQIFGLVTNSYVPLFKRFYFGGTGSVRGFPEDQILPADETNDLKISQGGMSVTLLRNEIRFPIKGALGGAVFADVGQLLNNISHWSFYNLAVGTGVGIRYLTPIGPIIFDVGLRVWDGDRAVRTSFWNSIGIHFSVGYP